MEGWITGLRVLTRRFCGVEKIRFHLNVLNSGTKKCHHILGVFCETT